MLPGARRTDDHSPCRSNLTRRRGRAKGTFTQLLIDRLREVDARAPRPRRGRAGDAIGRRLQLHQQRDLRRVRDRRAPASAIKRFGVLPGDAHRYREGDDAHRSRGGARPRIDDVGAPDYGDEGMLQYLRAERIIPPYQTRGYKLVELVRIYEVGTPARD